MRKRTYVFIIFISIVMFAKNVFLWIDRVTLDWVESNVDTFTNRDVLLIILAAILASALLAAIPGVIVSIILHKIKGTKSNQNADSNFENGERRERRIRERRERRQQRIERRQQRREIREQRRQQRIKPTKEELIHRFVAGTGLILAICSFLLCTGIEYAFLGYEGILNEVTNGDLGDDMLMAMLTAEGITGKWSILFKFIMAAGSENEFSLLSLLIPDKFLVISILAIVISGIHLYHYGVHKKINTIAIYIAVISILLDSSLSPWIQLMGGIVHYTFFTGIINYIVGIYDIIVHIIEYFVEVISPWFDADYLNQKYIDS